MYVLVVTAAIALHDGYTYPVTAEITLSIRQYAAADQVELNTVTTMFMIELSVINIAEYLSSFCQLPSMHYP